MSQSEERYRRNLNTGHADFRACALDHYYQLHSHLADEWTHTLHGIFAKGEKSTLKIPTKIVITIMLQ